MKIYCYIDKIYLSISISIDMIVRYIKIVSIYDMIMIYEIYIDVDKIMIEVFASSSIVLELCLHSIS
jgi:hypothetical protein